MAKINSNYDKLSAGYLFPEISRRVKVYSEKNPGIEILRLGVGNTTEALPSEIIKGLHASVDKLSNVKTYTGYGDEQGNKNLREAIVSYYKDLGAEILPDEVFVSDGAKCDVANIQSIFSNECKVAVQDPAYPVYVDTNVIAGRTGKNTGVTYDGLVYMGCNLENNFFPSLPTEKVDLIYICSPNNPTGAVATREQLKEFVDYAIKNKSVIIFDAAYNEFISDSTLPKTIYVIPGAKECAIEINSFSKSAGFTGVRLGWSIVPKNCVCEDASIGKLNSMWNRRQTTMFNGASNIVQDGGVAALSKEGLKECKEIIEYYMENSRIIKKGLEEKGLKVVSGGVNAPYLWVKTPNGMKSWDLFDKMLTEAHVVITPGSGFGPSGEGYFRVSAFGHRENVIKAVESIKNNLKL
ncbi:MAG: LL-diaminopimelate aminotransferase [archaeon]|jgi:LL-diaminopimelate aminotransferase